MSAFAISAAIPPAGVPLAAEMIDIDLNSEDLRSNVEALFVMVGSCSTTRQRGLLDRLGKGGFALKSTSPEPISIGAPSTRTPAYLLMLPATGTTPGAFPSPNDKSLTAENLTRQIRSLTNLRVAVALGVAAHMAILEACGVPRHRIPYRINAISALPDGLLLADAPHPTTHRPTNLTPLLEHIQTILGVNSDIASQRQD